MSPRQKEFFAPLPLGFLTFITTPLLAAVVFVPFFILGKFSPGFNPVLGIAGLFDLHELSGFFAAQFILIFLIALGGDIAAGWISLSLFRSRKAAIITFISAFILQSAVCAYALPHISQNSRENIQSGIEREKSYRQYAALDGISFEVRDPYSASEIDNEHPEFGEKYKELDIVVSVSVRRAGVYQVTASYNRMKTKKITQFLTEGDHIVKIPFLANEARSYGYWRPDSEHGQVEVQLGYLASRAELEASLPANQDSKILEQFMKDEGGRGPEKAHKFIESKNIQF